MLIQFILKRKYNDNSFFYIRYMLKPHNKAVKYIIEYTHQYDNFKS